MDESVLWAESEEHLGDGFRRIHMINNMDYIFDAEQAIPDYGGARDGTRLILFRWNGGQNQQWRIAPRSAPAAPGPELPPPEHARPVQILCRSGQGLSLTVRDGAAVLARADREDQRQVVCAPLLTLCSVPAAVVIASHDNVSFSCSVGSRASATPAT